MCQCWVVTQTGIITHFHASIPPLWNVTLYSVSFCFALAVLSLLYCTSVFLTLLGHYLLLFIFPLFVFISLPFRFPHRSFSILSLYLRFLYLRFLSLSLCFTCFYPNWYLAQMAVQLMCSGLLSECFTDLVLVHPLKLARVECVHTALLNWWCLQVILFENGPLMLK